MFGVTRRTVTKAAAKAFVAVVVVTLIAVVVYGMSRTQMRAEPVVPGIDSWVSKNFWAAPDRRGLIHMTIADANKWWEENPESSFSFKKGDTIPPEEMIIFSDETIVIWTDTGGQIPEGGCWYGILGLYEPQWVPVTYTTNGRPVLSAVKAFNSGWGLFRWWPGAAYTRVRCVAVSDGRGGVFVDYESRNAHR